MHRLQLNIRLALVLACLAVIQACATSSSLQLARDQFRHGSTDDALNTLSGADVSSRDRLLLYLDRGMVAQASGQYDNSIRAFERAIELVEQLDYVSVRDQSAALLTNDWATRYSGEYSERLWIHTFQMLNYLLLNRPEGAAVEARRAVALLEEHNDTLAQDVFTRSLTALSFLSAGQHSSAMVEYRKLKTDFDFPIPDALGKHEGELVLIIASGFIEPKLPGDLFIDTQARISFPYYPETFGLPPSVKVSAANSTLDVNQIDTTLVAISKDALAKRGKSIAARQALRVTAKYSIADEIGDENSLAGGIARLLLFVIEQADTRSWETLPAHLSLLRIPLEAGQQSLNIDLENYTDHTGLLSQYRQLDVDIVAGRRVFELIRLGVKQEKQN